MEALWHGKDAVMGMYDSEGGVLHLAHFDYDLHGRTR